MELKGDVGCGSELGFPAPFASLFTLMLAWRILVILYRNVPLIQPSLAAPSRRAGYRPGKQPSQGRSVMLSGRVSSVDCETYLICLSLGGRGESSRRRFNGIPSGFCGGKSTTSTVSCCICSSASGTASPLACYPRVIDFLCGHQLAVRLLAPSLTVWHRCDIRYRYRYCVAHPVNQIAPRR